MNDILNEYMRNNRATWGGVKRLHCNDGFSMSVQAGRCLYCMPRVDFEETRGYWEVEVGFPSELENLLMSYAEDPDSPTETVYGYVPTQLVIEVINKHGGINPNPEETS